MITIYALLDPDTKDVKYVGRTKSIKHRTWQHWRNGNKTKCAKWVQSLKSLDKKPEVLIVEIVRQEEAIEKEQYWIKHYRDQKQNLLNCSDGGSGPGINNRNPCGTKRSEQFKANMSLRFKGKPLKPETIAKLTKIRKGKPWSKKQRDNAEAINAKRLPLIIQLYERWKLGETQKEILENTEICISVFRKNIKKFPDYQEAKQQYRDNYYKREDVKAEIKTRTFYPMSPEHKEKMKEALRNKRAARKLL